MKPPSMLAHWRSLAITVLLSAATGWLGGQLGIRWAIRVFPGPAVGAIEWTLQQTLARDLMLSDQQRAEIAVIQTEFAPHSRALQDRVRAQNEELAQAILHGSESPQLIDASSTDMGNAVASLQRETLRNVLAIRNVLTASQRRSIRDSSIT